MNTSLPVSSSRKMLESSNTPGHGFEFVCEMLTQEFQAFTGYCITIRCNTAPDGRSLRDFPYPGDKRFYHQPPLVSDLSKGSKQPVPVHMAAAWNATVILADVD